MFLEQYPLCRRCESLGIVTAATVVDHVIPHKGDQVKFWDRGNWQPLCEACHNRKTAKHDR
jgi:5-methylcytosine-specific restriction protein A